MDVIYNKKKKKKASQEKLCTCLETLPVSIFQRNPKLVMEMLKCSLAHGPLPGAQSWLEKKIHIYTVYIQLNHLADIRS